MDRAEFRVLTDERVSLETARISGDGLVPAGHAVQPAERLDGGSSRFLAEVESVHDQRIHTTGLQVSGVDCSHNAICGIGQEDGQLQPP